MNIAELKKENKAVYVSHFRRIGDKLYPMSYIQKEELTWQISPTGGAVKVKIVDHEGKTKIGYSVCDDQDNFNRNIGNEKAIKNALLVEKTPSKIVSENSFLEWFWSMTKYIRVPRPIAEMEHGVEHIKDVVKSKVKRAVSKDFRIMIE